MIKLVRGVDKEENIGIYHEFVDRFDNSVPRVTAWHQEAVPCDAKQ